MNGDNPEQYSLHRPTFSAAQKSLRNALTANPGSDMITDSSPGSEGRKTLNRSLPMPAPRQNMSDFNRNRPPNKKRSKVTPRQKKKDPIFVDGARPRPMYVDYKDLELLTKLTSRQGKLIGRRKSGCTAASQHAVAKAIKRARFMALLPYVAD